MRCITKSASYDRLAKAVTQQRLSQMTEAEIRLAKALSAPSLVQPIGHSVLLPLSEMYRKQPKP